MNDSKTILISVKGKVQGVWYRASTCTKARSLGLCGTVENKPDGSVFIIVTGQKGPLEELVKWCWKGPEFSKVTDVSVSENPLLEMIDFKVLH